MLNKVTMHGRLVEEPELRTTTTGKSVTSNRIAVDRNLKDAPTDFFTVNFWNNQAETLCKYFHKGSQIIISGRLASNSYEDKEGNKRTRIEIVAEEIDFCGDKTEFKPVKEKLDESEELPF